MARRPRPEPRKSRLELVSDIIEDLVHYPGKGSVQLGAELVAEAVWEALSRIKAMERVLTVMSTKLGVTYTDVALPAMSENSPANEQALHRMVSLYLSQLTPPAKKHAKRRAAHKRR